MTKKKRVMVVHQIPKVTRRIPNADGYRNGCCFLLKIRQRPARCVNPGGELLIEHYLMARERGELDKGKRTG